MLPGDAAPIRTRRLELVVLEASIVDALASGDLAAAERWLGARVSRSLAIDASHLVQLRLAGEGAATAGFRGFARLIVRSRPNRRAIGSVGFHGPPDSAGRLEVSCRIQPAQRGRGYGAEATTGLLDWAADRFGIMRFLLAVPSPREAPRAVPIEIETGGTVGEEAVAGDLVALLDG